METQLSSRPFLKTVRAYFDVLGSSYTSVQANISFPLSYLKGGTAATWADTISRSLVNYPTWASFESELMKKFHNPFLEEDSRREMEHLEQGPLTALEYFIKCDNLKLNGNIDERLACDYIRVNLRPSLARALITAGQSKAAEE